MLEMYQPGPALLAREAEAVRLAQVRGRWLSIHCSPTFCCAIPPGISQATPGSGNGNAAPGLLVLEGSQGQGRT